MRIIHILSSSKYSGAENVVCQIIEMFNDQELEMCYCSPFGNIEVTLKNRHIQYISLRKMSLFNVYKAIRRYQPDIIHSHDIKASVYSALTTPFEIPVISHLHGNHEDMKRLSIKSFMFCIVYRRFSKIIVVSKSIKRDFYFPKALSKSIVLGNIINEKRILESIENKENAEQFDLVFLGRLSYPKDPIRVIRIISLVKVSIKDLKCVIVGDGELKESVKDEILKRDLLENVSLLGFVENPFKILSNSKIMIMASRFEGSPICALEAIMLGLPIVSTPTDGLLEIIDDGVTGYLSSNDEELAKKIVFLLTNESIRDCFSNKAKEKFKILNNNETYKQNMSLIYTNSRNKLKG